MKIRLLQIKNVKFKDEIKNIHINAEEISYFRKYEKLFAKDNVKLNDIKKSIEIRTDEITYLKNESKFFTNGDTVADISSKYTFSSQNIFFYKMR